MANDAIALYSFSTSPEASRLVEKVRALSDKPNANDSTREFRKIEAMINPLPQELASSRQVGKRSPLAFSTTVKLQHLFCSDILPYHYQQAILRSLTKKDDEEPSMNAEDDKVGVPRQMMFEKFTRGFDNEENVKDAAQQGIPQVMRRSNANDATNSLLLKIAYCMLRLQNCPRLFHY